MDLTGRVIARISGAPAKAPAAAKVEAAGVKSNPKVAGLQTLLATAKKKLDDAKTAGTPTRVLEDRVYEIEDELAAVPGQPAACQDRPPAQALTAIR